MTKKVKVGLGVFILLVCLSCLFIVSFVNSRAESFITNVISSSTNKEVLIGNVVYKFPLSLHAVDINIGRQLQIKEVYARLNIESVFSGDKIIIKDLKFIQPNFAIYKDKDVKKVPYSDGRSNSSKRNSKLGNLSSSKKKLRINKLKVENGIIDYVNNQSKKRFSVYLDSVDLTMNQLFFPLEDVKSEFTLKAHVNQDRLPIKASQFNAKGWINYPKKNLDALINISQKDGTSALSATAKSINNDMVVEGEILLNHLLATQNQESSIYSVNDLVYGIVEQMDASLGANFSFETKMDNFKISKVSFSGEVSTK